MPGAATRHKTAVSPTAISRTAARPSISSTCSKTLHHARADRTGASLATTTATSRASSSTQAPGPRRPKPPALRTAATRTLLARTSPGGSRTSRTPAAPKAGPCVGIRRSHRCDAVHPEGAGRQGCGLVQPGVSGLRRHDDWRNRGHYSGDTRHSHAGSRRGGSRCREDALDARVLLLLRDWRQWRL
jgi:hypothetical protein